MKGFGRIRDGLPVGRKRKKFFEWLHGPVDFTLATSLIKYSFDGIGEY